MKIHELPILACIDPKTKKDGLQQKNVVLQMFGAVNFESGFYCWLLDARVTMRIGLEKRVLSSLF